MRYMVTGGCGFIGSHTVDKLIDLGHEVHVIDNYSAKHHEHPWINKSAVNIEHDITLPLPDIHGEFEAVIHLASKISVEECEQDFQAVVDTNIIGTNNVLQWCVAHKVPRLIFASSSAIYGECPGLPELYYPYNPMSFYAWSKLSGEALCSTYANKHSIECCILRYFNVYGDRSPDAGKYMPVMNIFKNNLRRGEPFKLYNNGDNSRDFVHVSDVVTANILAANASGLNKIEVFNIGTGSPVTISRLAGNLSDHPVEYLNKRPNEPSMSWADNNKAKNMLQWYPDKHRLYQYLKELESSV